MRGFPYGNFPSGWFQVAWSDEIAVGDVVPKRYFSRDLVCTRPEAGEIAVFDAFCPHLGAHLGYGGRLEDGQLVCPFHGWRFDSEGRNCQIPYADRPNRVKRLTKWSAREANGAVLVWYDALDRPPLWEPLVLPEATDPGYWTSADLRKRHDRIRLIPQWVSENLVDPAHQKYVHGSYQPVTIADFKVEGPVFKIFNEVELGAGKETTWLTPDGSYLAQMNSEAWGVGLIAGRFPDQDGAVHYQAVTPIDEEYSELNMAVFVRRDAVETVDGVQRPDRKAKKRFDFLAYQLEADFIIWENMEYVANAPLTGIEARPYGSFRRWAAQFYPDGAGSDWSPETGERLVHETIASGAS